MATSAGARFRLAVHEEKPLQVVGTVSAYCALLAERAGFRSVYLSGAGVANSAFGIPDLGLTSLTEVCEEAWRITAVTQLPLLVDIDTGWGGALSIERTIDQLSRAGVAAVHIEDQVADKRCGHRPGKALVSAAEMCDRVAAAANASGKSEMVVMARTDAVAVEGLQPAIERALAYVQAGAEMIFAEALETPQQIREFAAQVPVPILINMTEFGKSPLLTRDQLRECGASVVLYPLSAFRAMSRAAVQVYETIRRHGDQMAALASMQTREELYEVLNYYETESRINQLLNARESHE